ncbi:MAG: LemA family protein [Actinomycetota bacterium]
MTGVYILIGIVALIVIGAIVSYNRFVSQRNLIRDSWSNIDTELRRRYDLIPNLIETVKGYAAHEKETLENVTKARAMALAAQDPEAAAQADNMLTAALRQLFAVSENYPNLKANENFLQLQNELANTEDRIQTSRRFYNANVRDYNRRVQSFPSMIVARFGKFTEEKFFEIDEAMREAGPPKVDFGTGGSAAGSGGGPAASATPPASNPAGSDAPTPPTGSPPAAPAG